MSKTNKRKHVMNQLSKDKFTLPKDNQSIVKVLRSRGNNLHEVITSEQETYLVSMPVKFRNNIWVKRKGFILVEAIPEGVKVKAEIIRILDDDTVKHYKENNVWPKEFEDKEEKVETSDDDYIFINPNREVESDSETDTGSEIDSYTDSSYSYISDDDIIIL